MSEDAKELVVEILRRRVTQITLRYIVVHQLQEQCEGSLSYWAPEMSLRAALQCYDIARCHLALKSFNPPEVILVWHQLRSNRDLDTTSSRMARRCSSSVIS
jgi:hypothetical protein